MTCPHSGDLRPDILHGTHKDSDGSLEALGHHQCKPREGRGHRQCRPRKGRGHSQCRPHEASSEYFSLSDIFCDVSQTSGKGDHLEGAKEISQLGLYLPLKPKDLSFIPRTKF